MFSNTLLIFRMQSFYMHWKSSDASRYLYALCEHIVHRSNNDIVILTCCFLFFFYMYIISSDAFFLWLKRDLLIFNKVMRYDEKKL